LAKIAPKSATPIEPPTWREERRSGGGDSQLLVGDSVLYGEHEHLHDHSQAETEHDHVQRDPPDRCVHPERGEQRKRHGHDRRARDWERPVAAETTDQVAAHDRRNKQAGHQWCELHGRSSSSLHLLKLLLLV
jgi:hypothetical protein